MAKEKVVRQRTRTLTLDQLVSALLPDGHPLGGEVQVRIQTKQGTEVSFGALAEALVLQWDEDEDPPPKPMPN